MRTEPGTKFRRHQWIRKLSSDSITAISGRDQFFVIIEYSYLMERVLITDMVHRWIRSESMMSKQLRFPITKFARPDDNEPYELLNRNFEYPWNKHDLGYQKTRNQQELWAVSCWQHGLSDRQTLISRWILCRKIREVTLNCGGQQ